jgi:hypothetical protein
MLKRQTREAALCNPALREAGIQVLAEACPQEPAGTWDLLRTTLERLWCKLCRRAALRYEELARRSGSQNSRPNLWSRFGSAC